LYLALDSEVGDLLFLEAQEERERWSFGMEIFWIEEYSWRMDPLIELEAPEEKQQYL